MVMNDETMCKNRTKHRKFSPLSIIAHDPEMFATKFQCISICRAEILRGGAAAAATAISKIQNENHITLRMLIKFSLAQWPNQIYLTKCNEITTSVYYGGVCKFGSFLGNTMLIMTRCVWSRGARRHHFGFVCGTESNNQLSHVHYPFHPSAAKPPAIYLISPQQPVDKIYENVKLHLFATLLLGFMVNLNVQVARVKSHTMHFMRTTAIQNVWKAKMDYLNEWRTGFKATAVYKN